MIRTKW